MDKDDLFNIQESLQSPEEELKKQNDKKKMKVQIYVCEGAYEQLKGYSQFMQLNIQNSFIIPTTLKQANINRLNELNQQSIDNGHKLQSQNLNKEKIDSLINTFLESQKQEQLQIKTEPQPQLQPQPQNEIKNQQKKQMIFRSMQNYQPNRNSSSKLQQHFLKTEFCYDRVVLNRITQYFKF
ncbi:unnamed protein product [Paramecium sonneborni]|uniref:Uncharacterized protein n=1 Tax=Paramecium sonneborni TaxID=65129 RepID=A0A8S1LTW6_9CILI|nr:unnamed protein product [Paramecium sonneborni]